MRNELDWLNRLRDYRDSLVHYRNLRTRLGHSTWSKKGSTGAASIPVVVPSGSSGRPGSTPQGHAPLRGGDDDEFPGLGTVFESTVEYNYTDERGEEKLVHSYEKTYAPARGFVEITEFMERELGQFESFVKSLIQALKAAGFQKHRLENS